MPAEGSAQEPGATPPPEHAGHWPPSQSEGMPGAMPGATPGGQPWPEGGAPPPPPPDAGMPQYGAPPYGATYGVPPYGYSYMAPPPPMAPATSGWATASLICSIAGLCTFGLASIAGVICGHIALGEIGAAQGRVEGRSLAIAGLVIGYTVIGLHLLIVLAFIAAIAASGPLR